MHMCNAHLVRNPGSKRLVHRAQGFVRTGTEEFVGHSSIRWGKNRRHFHFHAALWQARGGSRLL